jgi:hypothetical protein
LKNEIPFLYFDVNTREAVGWLITEEDDDFITLISDRSADPFPFEMRETFLFIIKSEILEVREVKINSLDLSRN